MIKIGKKKKKKVVILKVLGETAGKNHVWVEALVDGVKMRIRKPKGYDR